MCQSITLYDATMNKEKKRGETKRKRNFKTPKSSKGLMLHNRRKETVMFLCPGSQSVPPVSLYHHPANPPVPWCPMSTKKKEVKKANTCRAPIVPDSELWTWFSPVYLALLPSRPLQQKPHSLLPPCTRHCHTCLLKTVSLVSLVNSLILPSPFHINEASIAFLTQI